MKRLRYISTPPGRDARPSQVTPQQFVIGFPNYSPVPIILLCGGRHCESKLSCPRTQHNVPRPGLEPGPLDPGTSALTMRPPRVFALVKLVRQMVPYQDRTHRNNRAGKTREALLETCAASQNQYELKINQTERPLFLKKKL